MFKKLSFFLAFFLLFHQIFALSGNFLYLSDFSDYVNIKRNTLYCKNYQIPSEKFLKIKDSKVFALDLYLDIPDDRDFDSYLQFKVNGKEILFKNAVGIKNRDRVFLRNISGRRLIVFLEPYRDLEELNLEICSYLANVKSLAIRDESKIGFFNMPYFSCDDCFLKKLSKTNFGVNEIINTKIIFKNLGNRPANIVLKYNSYDVNTDMKILGGVFSYSGKVDAKSVGEINYSFKSLTDKSYIIPPAELRYRFDGYDFKVLSNPIIVNADNKSKVQCSLISPKIEYDVKEDAEINIICNNLGTAGEDINIILQINDKNVFSKKSKISALTAKTFSIAYSFDDFSKKEACLYINGKKNNCLKFYFEEPKSDYTIYLIVFVLMIVFGIFIYYYFFL